MQPPRDSRSPQIDLNSTETLRALILNATAAVTTLLILRVATLLINGADQATVPHYIQVVTTPLVWPFQLIPPFNIVLFREVTVIDVLLIPGVILAGLLATGVLTGWRESDGNVRRHPALTE